MQRQLCEAPFGNKIFSTMSSTDGKHNSYHWLKHSLLTWSLTEAHMVILIEDYSAFTIVFGPSNYR